MKKILFNDSCKLTEAVLNGHKTMTRRFIKEIPADDNVDISEWGLNDGGKACITLYEGRIPTTDIFPAYQPGEVVAIAQSYKDVGYSKDWVKENISPNPHAKPTDPFEKRYPGWNNKMFVKASLMPHQIEITNIRVERLQSISDEDCMEEGVKHFYWNGGIFYVVDGIHDYCVEPKIAFKDLINKISTKGTWEKNPWVFVYEFKLKQ